MIRFLKKGAMLFAAKPILIGMVLLLSQAGISSVAKAQSFSCANAQIPSEFTICNSEDLILLDEKLAGLFADARVASQNNTVVQKISESHGQWLRQRNECRVDFGCLLDSYRERIKELEKNGKPL